MHIVRQLGQRVGAGGHFDDQRLAGALELAALQFGEGGDEGGGGVGVVVAPSPMLRMGPLPRFTGEDQRGDVAQGGFDVFDALAGGVADLQGHDGGGDAIGDGA